MSSAFRAATGCAIWSVMLDMKLALSLYVDWHAGEAKLRHWTVGSHQVGQADLVERTANRYVYPLPRAADAAHRLQTAMAVAPAAFGNRDRPLEGVDQISSAAFRSVARQPVAAVG